MRPIVSFIFFWVIAFTGFCISDTTIFNSKFEKEVFQKFQNSEEVSTTDLLLAISHPEMQKAANYSIDRFVSQFNASQKNRNNQKRFFTSLYKSTHSEYLKKYIDERYFGDIFKTGEYNCVSATALFALILEQFKIDYEIKETPNHVYLIADPKNTGFLIETTTPARGVVTFDNRLMKSYVDYLHENKIISNEEYTRESIDQLFKKHFLTDKSITLAELAGLQYYNKGIFLYNKKDFKNAAREFEKADILYPANIIHFMQFQTYTNLLNNELQSKEYDGKVLAKYMNYGSENSIALQFAKEYFSNITNELVINRPNIKLYDAYFNKFQSFLNDSIDSDDFEHTYYSFKGYHEYVNYNYVEALRLLEKAYSLNPENIRTRQMITEISVKYLVVDGGHESRIDSIEFYLKKYPVLKQEILLNKFLKYCYAKVIGTKMDRNHITSGIEYFKRFEQLLNENPSLEVESDIIEAAYIPVAAHYVRRQMYNTAENTLKKALEFAPNSREIRSRINTIRGSKKQLYDYIDGSPTLPTAPTTPNNQVKKSNDLSGYFNIVDKNKDKINQNIEKFICNKWSSIAAIQDGIRENIPAGERLLLNIKNNGTVEFIIQNETESGSWYYDKESCILYIEGHDENEEMDMRIMVLEIDSKNLRVIISVEDNFNDFFEMIFVAGK